MTITAIIGGTGLNALPGFSIQEERQASTDWGTPSAALRFGSFHGTPCVFLPRHGDGHRLPPHLINYRANIRALADAGIRYVLAVAAVGGIRSDLPPGVVALPDQIIDYSWGRPGTFWDAEHADESLHIDSTTPFSTQLREVLIESGADLPLVTDGTYGVTQGPRLETTAEIRRMRQDGCDMVGMTCMPEAALAREAGLEYACIAVSVNWAAGIGDTDIHAEIEASLATGMGTVQALLQATLPRLQGA